MTIKTVKDLRIPDKYVNTHFPHKIGDEWYLIPNEARTSNDPSEKFECWLFDSNGFILRGISYPMTFEDLGQQTHKTNQLTKFLIEETRKGQILKKLFHEDADTIYSKPFEINRNKTPFDLDGIMSFN